VHGPFGQQFEDGGADVTAAASTTGATATVASSAASGTARSEGSGAEAGSETTGTETKAGSETETGVATALFTQVIAHFATCGATVFVHGPAIVGIAAEGHTWAAETLRSGEGAARERAFGWGEGGVHVFRFSLSAGSGALPMQ